MGQDQYPRFRPLPRHDFVEIDNIFLRHCWYAEAEMSSIKSLFVQNLRFSTSVCMYNLRNFNDIVKLQNRTIKDGFDKESRLHMYRKSIIWGVSCKPLALHQKIAPVGCHMIKGLQVRITFKCQSCGCVVDHVSFGSAR